MTNCTAVLLGGLLGTALGKILPQGLKDNLPTLFGFCSIAIGVNSIIKASGMTAVVLAILVGFAIGHSLHLEQWTSKFFHKLVRTLHLGGGPVLLQRLRLVQHPDRGHHRRSLTADVQSRAGRLHGHDLCLHAGAAICAIPLPQVVILLLVFGVGKLLAGVLTPTMFADLSACGGILTMAAGFRVSKIKSVPLVDLMPALILVMPFSALWSSLMQ
uniref:DUF554 family protein n=1 Tax=Faecalibacterium prausnitzii TaxID=853 RepID=UPI003FF0EC7D